MCENLQDSSWQIKNLTNTSDECDNNLRYHIVCMTFTSSTSSQGIYKILGIKVSEMFFIRHIRACICMCVCVSHPPPYPTGKQKSFYQLSWKKQYINGAIVAFFVSNCYCFHIMMPLCCCYCLFRNGAEQEGKVRRKAVEGSFDGGLRWGST